MGLVGTGSVDYRIREQHLPASRSFSLFDAAPLRGHPRFRMGLGGITCTGHAGFGCGVARRALDEISVIAESKRRKGRPTLIDDPIFQNEFAQAEAKLAAARGFAIAAIEELESCAVAQVPTARLRVRARLATSAALKSALEVAATCFRFSGSTGLRNGSAIGRAYRDLIAAEQHVFTDHNTYTDAGRVLLGIGPDTVLL